jgi:hypothetical protein
MTAKRVFGHGDGQGMDHGHWHEHGYGHVPTVPSWLSCPGCPATAFLSLLSRPCCPVMVILISLFCLGWPVGLPIQTVLYRSSCHRCPILLSCLNCPVMAVLLLFLFKLFRPSLSCHGCPVYSCMGTSNSWSKTAWELPIAFLKPPERTQISRRLYKSHLQFPCNFRTAVNHCRHRV